MGAVIEVILGKSVVSRMNDHVYVFHPLQNVAVDIPMPNEIDRMLEEGYSIQDIRLKEAPLNNFGPGGTFNEQSQNF